MRAEDTILVLVPLRDKSLLVSTEKTQEKDKNNNVLPYLSTSTASTSSSISNTSTPIIGRVELLQALWKACGCSSAGTSKGATTLKCPECKRTTDWAKRSLPKRCLRFQQSDQRGRTNTNTLQLEVFVLQNTTYSYRPWIRVKRKQERDYTDFDTALSLNKEVIKEEVMKEEEKQPGDTSTCNECWLGPLLLDEQDILQFCNPRTTDQVLEFRVAPVHSTRGGTKRKNTTSILPVPDNIAALPKKHQDDDESTKVGGKAADDLAPASSRSTTRTKVKKSIASASAKQTTEDSPWVGNRLLQDNDNANAQLKAAHEARVARNPSVHEAKAVCSPTPKRKRSRVDDDPNRRFPLGTFASGMSIYRNSLHPGETWEDGHVVISNLVLPGTTSALCTTFEGPEQAWLETFLEGVEHLIVVRRDLRLDGFRVIGDAELTPMDNKQGWFFLTAIPHNKGCLHAKLLLFRSKHGLRVVVCGSNLYEQQWKQDRDVSWVQDFVVAENQVSSTAAVDFGGHLRSFLDDLTKCRTALDQALMTTRLQAVFDGVNFSTAAARLVLSFPRPRGTKGKCTGGWKQLAKSVQELLPDTGDVEDSGKDSEESMVYAMSGSMGDIEPRFILHMHRAMHGIEYKGPKETNWDSVENLGLRCLWPSRTTALSMNFASLISSSRAQSMTHWGKIPNQAKRKIFLDARPNPPNMGLPQLACHSVSHAKVMIKTGGSIGVVYVGSHNFSKSAWGLCGISPKNVELGVVLASKSATLRQEWRSRLPCLLPAPSAQSPISYIPASAHEGVRSAYLKGRIEESFQLLREWLNSTQDKEHSHVPSKTSGKRVHDAIDLCDSD